VGTLGRGMEVKYYELTPTIQSHASGLTLGPKSAPDTLPANVFGLALVFGMHVWSQDTRV